MNVLSYRILLRQEPEGGYTVIVPSLPGCVTYGDTVEEAIEMAKEAIELYIESLKEHGEEIPTEEKTRTLAGAPSTDQGLLFLGTLLAHYASCLASRGCKRENVWYNRIVVNKQKPPVGQTRGSVLLKEGCRC